MSHLYKIRDKSGSLITFKRNRAQEHYSEHKHTRNLILKSRQLGFTTDEAIDSLDDTLFTPNTDSLLIAHNLEAGESIFDKKINLSWEKLPDEIKELWNVDSKTSKTLKFDFGRKGFSSIAVDTSGRSGTYRRVHITELADISKKYPKKIPDIIEGTIPAVPFDGRIDIESTSQGASGEFYDMFLYAYEWQKEHPDEILANYQWKAHFYNWTWDDEELGKIVTPIPFEKMEEEKKFRDYAQKFNLNLIQITYYYQKWLSLNRRWNALKREYPTTPEEAFEAIAEGTFYGEQIGLMEQNGQIGIYPYDPALKVHTVWDLGVGKNLRVGCFQRDTVYNKVRMIDHFVGEDSNGIPEAAKWIQRKPYIYGKHFGPHDIEATDIGTGKTRVESAKAVGIIFTSVPDFSIEDGINGVSGWLPRVLVNKETCKEWIKSMKNYCHEWDEKRAMYKDQPEHNWASHDADLSRYASLVENQMTNETFRVPSHFYDKNIEIWNGR